MIQPNETAFIRTTNEEVFVISTTDTDATIRRPVMTQDGIKHCTETFLLKELETIEDRVMREFADRKRIQQIVQSLEPADTPKPAEPLVN